MTTLKPHKTIPEQIELLKDKGFLIEDDHACEEFLNIVNYYRLAAYYLPFRKPDGSYFSGISFARICNIYRFDQRLRSLVFSVIEVIETYLRTQMSHYHTGLYGPGGYLDAKNFNNRHNHQDFIIRVQKCIDENKTSLIVKHHINTYEGRFPLWVAVEFFSMGLLSHFYLDLKTSDQKRLSHALYGVTPFVLEGWLRCITDLRNKCAHYSRLYYWIFTALPQFPDIDNTPVFPEHYRKTNLRRLFQQLYVLKLMYPNQIDWDEKLVKPLKELIQTYEKSISLVHIGFPPDWEQQLLYNK